MRKFKIGHLYEYDSTFEGQYNHFIFKVTDIKYNFNSQNVYSIEIVKRITSGASWERFYEISDMYEKSRNALRIHKISAFYD